MVAALAHSGRDECSWCVVTSTKTFVAKQRQRKYSLLPASAKYRNELDVLAKAEYHIVTIVRYL